ncbi:MAG: hypothetical protein ABII90_14670 [Bacteroidota bacterium]
MSHNLNTSGKDLPYLVNLDDIPDPVIDDKSIDLSKGKKILAFLLAKCSHCKTVAYKLAIANKKYDLPEIYFIFSGKEEDITYFMTESRSNFPFVIFNDRKIFEITKGVFPTIFYVDNSYVYKYWSGRTLTYSEMEKFSDL